MILMPLEDPYHKEARITEAVRRGKGKIRIDRILPFEVLLDVARKRGFRLIEKVLIGRTDDQHKLK